MSIITLLDNTVAALNGAGLGLTFIKRTIDIDAVDDVRKDVVVAIVDVQPAPDRMDDNLTLQVSTRVSTGKSPLIAKST